MTHRASRKFWLLYEALPHEIKTAADDAFAQLKANPRHPSLQFKKLGSTDFWSARVTRNYRVLGVQIEEGYLWFWIGSHGEYERLI